MKHLINALIFIALWVVGYYIGIKSTYIEGKDIRDILSMVLFLGGMGWLWYKYAR